MQRTIIGSKEERKNKQENKDKLSDCVQQIWVEIKYFCEVDVLWSAI